jgi:hypothetical protein
VPLSAEESERIFAAAPTAADRKRRSPRWAHRTWAVAVAASALVVILSPHWWVLSERRASSSATNEREKAGSPAFGIVDLTLLAAEPGRPESMRVVPPRGKIGLREVILFRVRLSESAYVTLLALSGTPSPPSLLWLDGASERHGPGEFEVASAGSALSVDLRKLGVPDDPSISRPSYRAGPSRPRKVATLPSDPRSLVAALQGARRLRRNNAQSARS